MSGFIRMTLCGVLLLGARLGLSQEPPPPDPPEAQAHVAAAARIGASDLATTAHLLCLPPSETLKVMRKDAASLPPPPPTRVFDNLYYVGIRSVGAWAINTSDGIILIDSLDNTKEAEQYIVGGLAQIGLDPQSIKYIIVTHAHGDHYGGAQYLADGIGARILMSEADWNELAHPHARPSGRPGPPPDWGAPPKRDLVLTDGQRITLGDTTVTAVLTPGHTPGTVSLIFPVKDHGVTHMAALWGGTAQPAELAASLQYEQSLQHFGRLTDQAHVDVEISNHPLTDDGLARMATMKSGQSGGKNPFVIGSAAYKRYMEIHEECLLAARARSSTTGSTSRDSASLPQEHARREP